MLIFSILITFQHSLIDISACTAKFRSDLSKCLLFTEILCYIYFQNYPLYVAVWTWL